MPRRPLPPPKPKRRSPNTGSVGTRSDGRVFASLPADLDPKRLPHYGPGKRRRFASVEEATVWLDREIARLRAPITQSVSATMTLGAYLAHWYRDNRPDWPERTAAAYALSLRRWAPIGDTPVGALTSTIVQSHIGAMRRMTWQRTKRDGTPTSEPRPYSRRTIQHARTVLYQALEDLVPEVIPHNPARVRRRRSRTEAEPEQPVWSADQAERVMATAETLEPRVALAIRLILRRALRTGEVIDLTWPDVDERAGTLTIDETPGLKRGTSGPTKTRRIRDVPLSADLIKRLRAHRRAYPATDPHVFTIRGERISLSYFRRLWHHIARVAQVPAIKPKDGRATCATILLDEGWSLPRVSQLLGHTSVATTAAFYARVIKRRADQTAQMGEELDATMERAAKRDAEDAPRLLREADGDV